MIGPTLKTNIEYYSLESPGRSDYWGKMAAPRSRCAVLMGLVSERPARSLADLGCGDGRFLGMVRAEYPSLSLCGVDSSAAQISSNRLERPEIAWHVADLGGPVAWPPGIRRHCDVVIASEIIEHVEDPEMFLRNALALARPGAGRLLLSTQSGRIGETERSVGHCRHFSKEEMIGLLSRTGWRPDRVWNAGFPFHDLSKWAANLAPHYAMQEFGGRSYGLFQNAICGALRCAFRFNSKRYGSQLFAAAGAPV